MKTFAAINSGDIHIITAKNSKKARSRAIFLCEGTNQWIRVIELPITFYKKKTEERTEYTVAFNNKRSEGTFDGKHYLYECLINLSDKNKVFLKLNAVKGKSLGEKINFALAPKRIKTEVVNRVLGKE